MSEEKGSLEAVDGGLNREPGPKPLHVIQEEIIRRKMLQLGARFVVGAGCFQVKGESLAPEELADWAWSEHQQLSVRGFRVVMKRLCRHLRSGEVARAKGKILDWDKNVGFATRIETQIEAGEELHKFVSLIEHPETSPERHEYYVQAWRQIIWQVKRKLRGEATSWEIMLCLYSKQGTGKSSAVSKFGAPLGDVLFLPMADFSLFSDKFRLRQLSHNYLICLDEMGRANKTDIDTVKQVITATTVQGRAMHTESERSMVRNANFIATTNRPVSSIITDSTGMRRFVEMRCSDEVYTDDFGEALNAIDFELVWTCEDGSPHMEPPAFVNRGLFDKYQAELRTPTDLEYFISTYLQKTSDASDKLLNKEVHNAYKQFCEEQNRKFTPINKFPRELQEHLPLNVKRSHNKVFYTHLKFIPQDAQ